MRIRTSTRERVSVMRIDSGLRGACLAVCAAAVLVANAQEPGGATRCARDRLGEPVCPPPFGSIARDPTGELVCGAGQCRRDAIGQIVCSSQPGGHVVEDRLGRLVCTGGCEKASAAACERPR
jgi:hypothetical protein